MAAMTTQELHDFVLSNSENISSSIVTSCVDRDFPCFEVKKENILDVGFFSLLSRKRKKWCMRAKEEMVYAL